MEKEVNIAKIMLTQNIKSAVLVREGLPESNIPVDIWDMK